MQQQAPAVAQAQPVAPPPMAGTPQPALGDTLPGVPGVTSPVTQGYNPVVDVLAAWKRGDFGPDSPESRAKVRAALTGQPPAAAAPAPSAPDLFDTLGLNQTRAGTSDTGELQSLQPAIDKTAQLLRNPHLDPAGKAALAQRLSGLIRRRNEIVAANSGR